MTPDGLSPERESADLVLPQHDEAAVSGVSLKRAGGAFFLSAVEAVCVFFVTSAKAGLVLVSANIAASAWAEFVHRDWLRLPLLGFAMAGAVLNLYLLWNAHTLRNAPSASWRKQDLPSGTRVRNVVVFSLSVATLLLAGTEIYLHRSLHHTIL